MDLDQAYIFDQSGVIPYRIGKQGLEVLLITSRGRKRWIIPKGIIEPGKSALESARDEAFEEAGVEGEIFPEVLGRFGYEKWGGRITVQVFPMKVRRLHPEWPESSWRKRRWFRLKDAVRSVDRLALRSILLELPKKLKFLDVRAE